MTKANGAHGLFLHQPDGKNETKKRVIRNVAKYSIFFSGEKAIVYTDYTEDMHSLSDFKTLKNKVHYEIFIPTNVDHH